MMNGGSKRGPDFWAFAQEKLHSEGAGGREHLLSIWKDLHVQGSRLLHPGGCIAMSRFLTLSVAVKDVKGGGNRCGEDMRPWNFERGIREKTRSCV